MGAAQMATYSVIDTLAGLVRINSVNPAYERGVSEAAIAAYMQHFFRAHEIETIEQTVFSGRPNLITKLPGRDSSRRIIFEVHMDTAGISGMTIPAFEREINGKLYGRGSCDTKAGLAAMMCALASLSRDRRIPLCEIWVVAPPTKNSPIAESCACAKVCRRTQRLLPNRPHYGWSSPPKAASAFGLLYGVKPLTAQSLTWA